VNPQTTLTVHGPQAKWFPWSIAVVLLLVLFIAGGVITWTVADRFGASAAGPAIHRLPSRTATASASQPPHPLTNRIRQFVEGHFRRKEAHNIDELITHYANQVDYFEDKNVNRDFIREDFVKYLHKWPDII
jgi:hypothetical protein